MPAFNITHERPGIKSHVTDLVKGENNVMVSQRSVKLRMLPLTTYKALKLSSGNLCFYTIKSKKTLGI